MKRDSVTNEVAILARQCSPVSREEVCKSPNNLTMERKRKRNEMEKSCRELDWKDEETKKKDTVEEERAIQWTSV